MTKREESVMRDELKAFLTDNGLMETFSEYCIERTFIDLYNFAYEE